MQTGKFSTVEFSELPYERMMEVQEACFEIETAKTPFSELSLYQLEAMIWYYRLGSENCFECDQPQTWDEEMSYRYEAMRCAEAIAQIFQRRYETAKKHHDEWLAEKRGKSEPMS